MNFFQVLTSKLANCKTLMKSTGTSGPTNTVLLIRKSTRCFPCFLHDFLVKLDSQWQFWNLLVMRIPKLSLIFEFDEVLAEIFKVKDNWEHFKNKLLFDFYWLFGNGALPSTLNNSVNSSSNSKIRDSFGICLSWGFRNCHWFLELMKDWLNYSRLKTKLHFQRVNKSWREANFWNALNCL